jgi:hypothetical protein
MAGNKFGLISVQLRAIRESLQSTFPARFAQTLMSAWPHADRRSSAYDLAVRQVAVTVFEAASAAWLDALFAAVQAIQREAAALGEAVDGFAEDEVRALGRAAAGIAAARSRPEAGTAPVDAVQAAEDRLVATTLARLRLNRLGVPLHGTVAAMANITNTIHVSGSGNTVLAGQHQTASISQALTQQSVTQPQALAALEELGRIVAADGSLSDRNRTEILEVIEDVRPQINNPAPNMTKLRGILDGLKAGCETVTAAGPAVQQLLQWFAGIGP